jgi:hypothetical protein
MNIVIQYIPSLILILILISTIRYDTIRYYYYYEYQSATQPLSLLLLLLLDLFLIFLKLLDIILEPVYHTIPIKFQNLTSIPLKLATLGI